MTQKIYEAIDDLRKVLKEEMSSNTTSVTIFFNSQGSELSSSHRNQSELRQESISMKNIAGDWIK